MIVSWKRRVFSEALKNAEQKFGWNPVAEDRSNSGKKISLA